MLWIFSFLALPQNSWATVIDPDDVITKTTGDAISAGEFNTVVDVLRGMIKDDNGTSSFLDDKIGLFLPAGNTPTQALEVNGGVKATYIYGDGSNITNLPDVHWTKSGNDINYSVGRVGIGVASPEESLHVAGTVKATNFIRSDGSSVELWAESGGNISRNSGNVGIGTATPGAKLHVLYGAGDQNLILERQEESVSGAAIAQRKARGTVGSPALVQSGDVLGGIASYGYDGANYLDAARIRTSVDGVASSGVVPGRFEFLTRDTSGNFAERMRIDSTGNVGIGTASPGAKLDVAGTARFSGSNGVIILRDTGQAKTENAFGGVINFYDKNDSAAGWIGYGSSGNNNFNIYNSLASDFGISTSGSQRLLIDSAGNVGIGTAIPTELLHLSKDGAGDAVALLVENLNSAGGAEIEMKESGGGNWKVKAIAGNAGFKIRDQSAGADRLTIDSTGNVGIGTTIPNQKLHVEGGDVRINSGGNGSLSFGTGNQYIYGDGNSALYYRSVHDTVTQMIFRDAQGTTYGRIYGDGNGTNFGLLDGDGNWGIRMSKDNFTEFRVNDDEKMRITSAGRLGIGTTSPSSALEVVGDIEFSGKIKLTSGSVDLRCPVDSVMVGFSTAGILCDFPPLLYQ